MPWLIALFGVSFRWGLMSPLGRKAMQRALLMARRNWDSTGDMNRRVMLWFAGALGAKKGIEEFGDEVMQGAHNLVAGVCEALSEKLGVIVRSLDAESLKHAGGQAAANEFNKIVLQKTGFESPISDFYTPDIAEQFGTWFADIANQKASEQLGYDVRILSTVYPTDNVKSELDTFITGELNTRLKLNITSVLTDRQQFVTQLETQVIDKIKVEMIRQLEVAKTESINELSTKLGLTQQEMTMAYRVSGMMLATILERFSVKKVFGYKVDAINYYQNNKARIANANRQRRHRLTHHEQREWVAGGRGGGDVIT